jgi:hypothetical protein
MGNSMSLSTGFVKVAQSGKTIDGREIKPEWLLQAANNYSKQIYVANIYPEHDETLPSYGTVEEVRAEQEGDIVELYARLSPNVNWIIDASKGDKLFTSIALMPNFQDTGQMYLYSMAATNNPASIGVEQLRFSKKEIHVSDALETQASNDAEVLSFFRKFLKLFNREVDDMSQSDKEALADLQQKFTTLETKYSSLLADKTENKTADKTPTAEEFSALKAENEQLKTKLGDLESKLNEFSGLRAELDAHKVEFAKAIKQELPGTDAKTGGIVASNFSIEREI